MAGEAEGLIAHRAALLVRCQQARESRCRAETARAGQMCARAGAALQQARDALDAHETIRAEETRRAYDAVTRRQMIAADLQRLPDLERQLATRTSALSRELASANQALRQAEAAEQAARRALAREARKTQRRQRLAQVAADRCRRVRDMAEELQREDQVADRWSPA